jgi:internalin A
MEINDVSSLYNLKNLNILYLQKNRISSIEPIKTLLNLKVLNVSENCISDFSPIDYLKENGKLTTVSGAKVSDQDYDRCK